MHAVKEQGASNAENNNPNRFLAARRFARLRAGRPGECRPGGLRWFVRRSWSGFDRRIAGAGDSAACDIVSFGVLVGADERDQFRHSRPDHARLVHGRCDLDEYCGRRHV